jgi:hypothetical protein
LLPVRSLVNHLQIFSEVFQQLVGHEAQGVA